MAATSTTRRRRSVERAGNNIISLAPNEERVNTPLGYSTYTSMYKQHPIVRAAIDKLAKQCVANGYSFLPRDTTKALNKAKADDLNEIFARSKTNNLLRSTYTDLLIYGDAYWFITKSRKQVPYQFLRQAPSTISVIVDTETRDVTGYITRDSKGKETQWEAEDFLHFKLFDPDNDVYGLSLLESLKSTVAQDLFAQTYNEAFFANSAQTGIVFNMRNASKEEVERNREFLKKEYTSAANAHKPLLLEGDVEVSRSVASPAEMQFIDGRQQLMMEILAVFDVPYTKIGGTSESANRSQSAENDKSFRAESIVPLQGIIEEVLNEDFILTVMSIDDTVFAHEEVDLRDEKEKAEIWMDYLDRGVMSINEVRSNLGLKAIPGGDNPYINTAVGLMPVAKAEEYIQGQMDAKKAGAMASAESQEPDEDDTEDEDEMPDASPSGQPAPPQRQGGAARKKE